MEYSKNINEIIMRSRHKFVYGSAEEREAFFKKLTQEYAFSLTKEGPVGIYLKDDGLKDCYGNINRKLDSTSIIKRYFEALVAFNIIDNLLNSISRKDLGDKVLDLIYFFNLSNRYCRFLSLEEIREELRREIEIYKESYDILLNTGVYPNILKDVRLRYIMIDMLARRLKLILPNLERINLIIDKDSSYGKTYTKAINQYMNRRINEDISFTIGVKDFDDWPIYTDLRCEKIMFTHDYTIVKLDDFRLIRKMEE